MEFLCGSLRPIIDGKIKPDQLRLLLDVEINRMEEEHYAPVNVLTKAADAMPGFGIVAAVLGIVITMASISGPIDRSANASPPRWSERSWASSSPTVSSTRWP